MSKEELREKRNRMIESLNDIKAMFGLDELYIDELEKKNTALRQDWEIMKNTIADYNDFCDKYMRLEKENAELKEKYAKNVTDCDICDTYCNSQLAKAREIILKLYNAGRDVLMCRAEEKAYDNLSNAINDKSIEQFLSEVEK